MGKTELSRPAVAAVSRRPQIELRDAASWQRIDDARLETNETAN
jgi:hypothetical protein